MTHLRSDRKGHSTLRTDLASLAALFASSVVLVTGCGDADDGWREAQKKKSCVFPAGAPQPLGNPHAIRLDSKKLKLEDQHNYRVTLEFQPKGAGKKQKVVSEVTDFMVMPGDADGVLPWPGYQTSNKHKKSYPFLATQLVFSQEGKGKLKVERPDTKKAGRFKKVEECTLEVKLDTKRCEVPNGALQAQGPWTPVWIHFKKLVGHQVGRYTLTVEFTPTAGNTVVSRPTFIQRKEYVLGNADPRERGGTKPGGLRNPFLAGMGVYKSRGSGSRKRGA